MSYTRNGFIGRSLGILSASGTLKSKMGDTAEKAGVKYSSSLYITSKLLARGCDLRCKGRLQHITLFMAVPISVLLI